jgi:hypothetical protein
MDLRVMSFTKLFLRYKNCDLPLTASANLFFLYPGGELLSLLLLNTGVTM